MIPAGYMAKRVSEKPDWLKAAQVTDIYSISGCVSSDFADYINYWKHNGFWFFDTPEVIRNVAHQYSIDLEGTSLFYYEVHEEEFDGKGWHEFRPDSSIPTNVIVPVDKRLEGLDVVTFWSKNAAECSPLSCNGLAEELTTNSHCLFASFADAENSLENGKFSDSEPGPYRILSVYSVKWG
ncbi:MAG TPA: hypothetical protein VLX32_04890 [Candidatus Acidoferrum sp.]|nr:hypothetical protein [Candidatus Acidoferrum sp.]